MSYRMRGFGDVPPLGPGMKDCGGGTSVRQDLPCPVLTPINMNDPNVIAAQTAYDARIARCKVYQNKEYMIDAAAGLLAVFLLPGAWKLLAIPIAIAVEWNYPRSTDCDYGF